MWVQARGLVDVDFFFITGATFSWVAVLEGAYFVVTYGTYVDVLIAVLLLAISNTIGWTLGRLFLVPRRLGLSDAEVVLERGPFRPLHLDWEDLEPNLSRRSMGKLNVRYRSSESSRVGRFVLTRNQATALLTYKSFPPWERTAAVRAIAGGA